MSAIRTELVDRFTKLASDKELAHSYLIVSRDLISLEATARAIQQAIDGPFRLSLGDGLIVEVDGSSIGIDAAREAREHLGQFPGVAPYRTALILQAELLTSEAQNALLKVAEEPAAQSVLILAVTDENRILPTLRSRLQRIPLTPLSEDEVGAWLAKEGSAHAKEHASHSGGSLGLASELDSETPTRSFAQALIKAPEKQVASILKEAATAEITLKQLLRALATELAYTERTARSHELWHRVQRLIAASETSPLSLRLQLAALFTDLPL